MADLPVEATVNGRRVARQANPSQRVLDFLRDDLHMTGIKEGCGAGECGTCSVFVDGVLVKSCLLPVAKIAGKKVDTIEGLAVSGEMSAVQNAFHNSRARPRFAPPQKPIARRSRNVLAAISAAARAIRRYSTPSRWRGII